jgi:hypothetical protein
MAQAYHGASAGAGSADVYSQMPRADSADAAGAFFVAGCRCGAAAKCKSPWRSRRGRSGMPGKPRWTSASNPSWATFSPSRARSRTPVRAGVRVALADSEAIFRAQEPNKRMRDQAARVSRALCRSRVVAEMHQRAAKLLTRDEARRSGGLCGVGFSTGRSALRSTMPR